MKHSVLLVDDDENLLHGLVRSLHGQPYQLYTARSGEEARWVLKRQSIDVVVADEQIPGLSGTDLLAWVADYFPDVVRILLTGHPNVATAMRAINEGSVFRFFTKPCKEFELAMGIRQALERAAELRKARRLLESAEGSRI